MEKKLMKAKNNKVLAGVCAGIAKYFNVDVTLVRLAAVLLVLAMGMSIWVYIIAAVIMPEESAGDESCFQQYNNNQQ